MSVGEGPIAGKDLIKELKKHGYGPLTSHGWVLDGNIFWSLSDEALLAKTKMDFEKAHRLCHLRKEWEVGKIPGIRYHPAGEACPTRQF